MKLYTTLAILTLVLLLVVPFVHAQEAEPEEQDVDQHAVVDRFRDHVSTALGLTRLPGIAPPPTPASAIPRPPRNPAQDRGGACTGGPAAEA